MNLGAFDDRRASLATSSTENIYYNSTARDTTMTKKIANLDRYETLTSRERVVLNLIAEGLTDAEIATRLGISFETAETHRSVLMQKLDLHTQADLVRFALRRGIVTMEE